MITTIEEWSTAFSSYMAIIIEKFPERAQELIQYFMTIRYASNDTTGLAWVVYDSQFRTQAANNRNLNWGHIDMQLWVKIFCVAEEYARRIYEGPERVSNLTGHVSFVKDKTAPTNTNAITALETTQVSSVPTRGGNPTDPKGNSKQATTT